MAYNRTAIISKLIQEAIAEVERRYGTGKGDGLSPLQYHNARHTKDVVSAAKKITNLAMYASKISEHEQGLVLIAAAFHDIEQGLGRGPNEDQSAALAAEAMQKHSVFSENDIAQVQRIIAATKVSFESGVMAQSATEDYLTHIMADADLASLGDTRDIYWSRAIALLKEMKQTDNPSPEDLLVFARSQIALLEHHTFYTEEAARLFPNQIANKNFTLLYIEQLEKS